MISIPDFNDNELWIIRDTLKQRYREAVEPELAEIEMRLDPHSTELTVCPALVWKHDAASLIIVKTGEERYRAQFFYRVHQQYGTGVNEYSDLTECVVTLLQVQADHNAQQAEEAEKNN